MNLNPDIEARLAAFYRAREWERFQSLKDLAVSAGIELGELLEMFLWRTPSEEPEILSNRRTDIENELADVFINCLNFARRAEIDVAAAIHRKLDALEERYPVDRVKGLVIDHG